MSEHDVLLRASQTLTAKERRERKDRILILVSALFAFFAVKSGFMLVLVVASPR
jgi:hypothetical protein